MNTRFEIIVNVNGERNYLDTYQSEPISLNYNIADLTDINARNSSYSKTIKIPETKKNRQLFGDIADLASSTQFDPNKKTRAWVLVDGVMVLEGYLQLRFVYVDKFKDKTEYEVVIYADNDNFFKALGEKYLTDLEWSELNHVWSGANIRASWTASSDSLGYFYPLIDYGKDYDYNNIGRIPVGVNPISNGIPANHFFPATNVKYMVDKIFQDAGYTYESNFLNSSVFKKLYIPFSGQVMSNPTDGDNLFSAGRLTAVSFSTQYAASNVVIGNPGASNYVLPYPTSMVPPGNIDYNYVVRPYDWGVYRLPFNSEAAPNGDPNGVYNTLTYNFRAPSTGLIRSMKFVCNFDIQLQFGIDIAEGIDPIDPNVINTPLITYNTNPLHGPPASPANWIAFRRSFNAAGQPAANRFLPVNGVAGRIPLGSPLIKNLELLDPITIDVYEENNNPSPNITQVVRYRRVRGTIESDFLSGASGFVNNYRLSNNEDVWVEIKLGIDSGEYREQINLQNGIGVGWGGNGNGYFIGPNIISANAIQGTQQRPNVPPGLPLGTFSSSLRFYNNVQEILLLGDVIDYNQIIPKQIKNKDFLSSLIKMFNLYIEPSKTLERVLRIEPRDDYYANGEIKDWTGKVDLTTPIKEQILAETQNREIRLKYREDTDWFNQDYLKKQNISFGEYRKIIDNEFNSGIKSIEPIFSPTPLDLMPNSQRIIIPKIGKLNNEVFEGTDINIRILTRYEPNQTSTWLFGGLTTSVSPNFPDYAVITSQGIAPQRIHAFNVGDVLSINQTDGGITYPTLQGTFEVLEVINNRTIVISLTPRPTWVGYVSGNATPLPGVVGSDKWYFLDGPTFREVNYYPYLGHFSHPRRPNYDLNFGQAVGYYHPLETITSNTLYNTYWSGFINEITDKDSRIITIDANLTANDINEFSFSDNIHIAGQYYKVNKIVNYDPVSGRPCKVELIKSKTTQIPKPELGFGGVFGRYEAPGPERQPSVLDYPSSVNSLTTARDNNISRADVIIAGRDNEVAGNRSLVIGSRNQIYSDQNIVFGNNNLVSNLTNGNMVLGSGNTIDMGVQNSLVIGNGLTIQSSNTLGFGGVIVAFSNYIQSGKNEVLSPFTMKPPNYIEAGKNAIINFGSQDPVNYIQGNFYQRED